MDRQKDSNSITLIHLRLQAQVKLTVTIISSFLFSLDAKYGITGLQIDGGLSHNDGDPKIIRWGFEQNFLTQMGIKLVCISLEMAIENQFVSTFYGNSVPKMELC